MSVNVVLKVLCTIFKLERQLFKQLRHLTYAENGAKNRKVTPVKVQNDAHWIQLKSHGTEKSCFSAQCRIIAQI